VDIEFGVEKKVFEWKKIPRYHYWCKRYV